VENKDCLPEEQIFRQVYKYKSQAFVLNPSGDKLDMIHLQAKSMITN